MKQKIYSQEVFCLADVLKFNKRIKKKGFRLGYADIIGFVTQDTEKRIIEEVVELDSSLSKTIKLGVTSIDGKRFLGINWTVISSDLFYNKLYNIFLYCFIIMSLDSSFVG